MSDAIQKMTKEEIFNQNLAILNAATEVVCGVFHNVLGGEEAANTLGDTVVTGDVVSDQFLTNIAKYLAV